MNAFSKIVAAKPFSIWRDLKRRRKLLRLVVSRIVGRLPPYSTLKTPKIVDIEAVPIASGTALVFEEFGVAKIVLIRAGAHYENDTKGNIRYMIPGGFINLTETPGSSYVKSSSNPESPRVGAARKIEKKLCNGIGEPLLRVLPERLVPIDTLTLPLVGKKKRVVVGHMLRLAAEEVGQIKNHIAQTQSDDPTYRLSASAHTANTSSGKPEVVEICIFDLIDAAEGKVPLLHQDQQSLFKRVLVDRRRLNGKVPTIV